MEMKIKIAILAAVQLLVINEVHSELAVPCNETLCTDLTTCRCSSTDTPGGLEFSNIPQFVLISFDDGVTVTNYPFYEELSSHSNPNGCPISMTFFVSHENSNYTLVNSLYNMLHEIAIHSVTHKADIEHYWRNMTNQTWIEEMVDMRTILNTYANIPSEDIVGFRVPFLEVGGNMMYEQLLANDFKYDCSWPTLQYTPWYVGPSGTPFGALWPYTLDFKSIQEQTVGTKPVDSFPGFWVNPMTDMQDNRGIECPMLDLCQSSDGELESSPEAVAELLKRNFKAHYYSSRTPFGLYAHQAWFMQNTTVRTEGFTQFLDYLSAFPDVYVISIGRLIEWVKSPVAMDNMDNFEPIQCNIYPDIECPDPQNCQYTENLPIESKEIYMNICQRPCPTNYPWAGNPYGM